MRKAIRKFRTVVSIGIALSVLGACGGVQIGADALVQHLPPGQDQACRAAVRDALAEKNVSDDWIRRVHYQAVRTGNRIRGFEAWVFPEEGRGSLVVEMTIDCRVTGIWARGMR